MREAIPAIAAASIIALLAGAALSYFLFAKAEPAPADRPSPQDASLANVGATPLGDAASKSDGGPDANADLQGLLNEAKTQNTDLQNEIKQLKEAKQSLEADKTRLESEIKAAREELKTLKDAAAGGSSSMQVDFGKWSEVEGLRNADWKAVGSVYSQLDAILKERVTALREGREPDPEGEKKINELNKQLQNHLVTFFNRLPTNSGPNGQYTHPANMVNILAGQLAAAGLPLSEEQVKQLSELGEEYDRRWEALQKGYSETTWTLAKVLDECELKEWFHDEMFKVCTPQQKAAAISPEIEGLVGADFYSAGLILLTGYLAPAELSDASEAKPKLREVLAERGGLSLETLDAADFLVDDWVSAISAQLTPKTGIEAAMPRTWDVLKAGRAQLTALKALHESYAATDDIKKRLANMARIIVLRVVLPE
jgi:hypothetical protein